MKKLNLNIDEEIAILEKYQLSPNELFVIRILLLETEEYDENYLHRFLSIKVVDLRSILLSLQEKGIILKSYKIPNKGERFYPEDVAFSQNFLKSLYKSSFELGQELFETYPAFTNINGVTFSLRNVAKKYNSLEDFFRNYGKSINHNPETHKRVINNIKWALDNTSYLNFGICEFVISRKWEEIELLKNGDFSNVNFDAIRSL